MSLSSLTGTIIVLAVLAFCCTGSTLADSLPGGVHREAIEWTDIWIADGSGTALPRVLLIGDSITRQYYPNVSQLLSGQASVSRYCTSACIADPSFIDGLIPTLKSYRWKIIQFNNGMHGWDYTEDEYRKAYPRAIEAIQKYAPGAIIVIASTTPTDSADTKSTANPQTDRIVVRNQAAAAVAAANHFPVDDVFTTAYGHPECFDSGGIHFNPTGIGVLAARVTASITPMLAKQ